MTHDAIDQRRRENRRPVVPGKGTRKMRRLPKARRLELLRAAGIAKWSGRQWRKLRKQMRREWKAQQREHRERGAR